MGGRLRRKASFSKVHEFFIGAIIIYIDRPFHILDHLHTQGRQVPGWDLSYYVRGYERNWYPAERKRPKLAFTVVFATDKAMAVRGSKTGGAAIFRKIPEDMSEVAYGT